MAGVQTPESRRTRCPRLPHTPMIKLTNLSRGLSARVRNSAFQNRIGLLSITGLGLILAIAIRIPLLDFKSLDYYQDRIQSFPLIQSQGFAALANSGSAYNPTY